MSVPASGMPFKEQQWCEHCLTVAPHVQDIPCFCGAQDALAELVELKRIKDAGGPFPPEYERRKLIAWQTAFRVCGVIGEPK